MMARMRGRSHRHRVPTARPPGEALGVIYLWGRGEIASELRSYLREQQASISEHDDVARKLALDHGCPLDLVPGAWAWRVEGVSSRDIDDLTRSDASVMGWTQFQRETCPSSLALRNAINAVTKDELVDIAGTLAERFGRPGNAHAEGDPNRWIAKDNRVVFFDERTGEWRLGDYAGA